MLTAIKGYKQEKRKIDYCALYLKVFIKALEAQDKCRSIFSGVKYFGLLNLDDVDKSSTFGLMSFVKSLIATLTPRELAQLFPVRKVYDGKKWQVKDYFSTMEVLNQHGLDTPINEAVEEILWEYTNRDLSLFQVNMMSVIGKLYRAETGRDMLVEFFEEQGCPLTTYSEVINPANGKRFMRNNTTGEFMQVMKPRPRHLKVVRK